MKRLTIKKEYRTNVRYYKPKNVLISDLTFKLGQLENIEEDLGISLVVLFKALKNGVYIKFSDEDEIEFEELVELDLTAEFFPDVLWCLEYSIGELYFKDYGKTWALTRDELEK